MKSFVRLTITAAALAMSGSAFAAGTVYATYTGSQQGVTERDSTTLGQTFFYGTGVDATGIDVANGHVYTSAANHLYDHTTAGALVTDMTFPDTGILYSGVAVDNGTVYASYTGSQQGVTIRDLGLNQTGLFGTDVDATGIAVGDGNVFLSAGNHLLRYTTGGTLLIDMTFPDTGILYTGVAYKGGTVFATYAGSQLGITVRDLNLNQSLSFGTGVTASDITVGDANNLFITAGNSIYEYSYGGALLNTMTFPDQGINYSAITFEPNAVPEPASWAMMIGGFAVVGATMRRRKVALRFA